MPTQAEPPLARRQRWSILAAVFAAHLLAIWGLVLESSAPPSSPAVTTTLVFITDPPAVPEVPEPVAEPPPALPPPSAEPVRRRPSSRPLAAAAPSAADAATAATSSDTPTAMLAVDPEPPRLRLYDADGSLALPDDVVARLEEVDTGRRAFDFQQPGLLEAGSFMERPPALAYEPTMFDAYWKPEKDALTAILEEAVRRSVKTVEIPVPGSPGSKLVCSVSMLALGGGCGVRDNNEGYVPELDDPDTLSPAEQAQCAAWWEQIVAATSQESWRQTRALYDFTCRKPPAAESGPPDPDNPGLWRRP